MNTSHCNPSMRDAFDTPVEHAEGPSHGRAIAMIGSIAGLELKKNEFQVVGAENLVRVFQTGVQFACEENHKEVSP